MKRVIYVLAKPELCGGVKVVFQHAQVLINKGIEASVAGLGPMPSWAAYHGAYIDLTRSELPVKDTLLIATYYTIIPLALGKGARVAHFCQGYEGGLQHLAAEVPKIEAMYKLDLPTLVVAPHLGRLLAERFGRRSWLVEPPLDPLFSRRPSAERAINPRPKIFVSGIFEADVKGIPTALEAVRLMRQRGLDCEIIRVSLLPLSRQERDILEPDVYLTRVQPADLARQLHECDLCLFTSRPTEGFGLIMLEAMAGSVPVVGSDIPSIRHMTRGQLPLAAHDDPSAFADLGIRLLTDRDYRGSAVETGFRLSQNYDPHIIGDQLVHALKEIWSDAANGRSQQ